MSFPKLGACAPVATKVFKGEMSGLLRLSASTDYKMRNIKKAR